MFSDFWMGDGNQHKFWTKQEAVDYWKSYAKHFGVLDKIRFNSKVVTVTRQGNKGWQVQLASGESLFSQRVALAIGNNSIPNYPQWKDLLTEVKFSHSQEYRNADRFVGKNVLVVGGGESASDIGLYQIRWQWKCYQKPGFLKVNVSIVGYLRQTRFLYFFTPILPDLILEISRVAKTCKEALVQELIAKLPVSPFNHVVKAGLKGRLIYGFKAIAHGVDESDLFC